MEKPVEPGRKPLKSILITSFQLILTVSGLAFLFATLFTAWTPGLSAPEFIPVSTNGKVINLEPNATMIPTNESIPPTLKIGIVAGHWGNDSGAVCGDGFTEAELNLDIATLVQKRLAEMDYEVEILEEFDDRLKGYKAVALVSIHADSCDYYSDLATGFKVAASMANPHPEKSARLTSCLRSRYNQATGLPIHSTSVTVDMTDYHSFGEIDENTTAAIIEIGFLNLDREYLVNNKDDVTTGIVNGILCYLNQEEIVPTQEQP
jgi:N-acetylmuramoyl-L-alanine amidase